MSTPPSSPGTETEQVLLVDDNRTNLQILHQTLHGRGYRLLVATNGEQALATVQRTKPALVLLDIMMPGVDGFEVCRRLKSNPETWDSAVIFLSALGDTQDKVHGLELGAVDYIAKPFQPEEVIARVATHLRLHRLEQDLAQRNRQLEMLQGRILQAMGEGILGLDREGTVTFVNHAAAVLMAQTETELVGSRIHDFLADTPAGATPQRSRACAILKTIEEGRTRYEDNEVFRRKDGSDFPVEYTAAPVFDADLVTGAVVVFRDLSDRRRAEQELKAAHQGLLQSHEELKTAQMRLIQAAKLESVGRLAAGVAHEVKNPLAILQLGLDYLSDAVANDETCAAVILDMNDAVVRADSVIKGLLDFSREQQLDLASGDLNQVIGDSLNLVRHETTQRNIRVIEQMDDSIPPFPLDANKLQQVFINLFMNAIHAMEKDGELKVMTRRYRLRHEDVAGGEASAGLAAGDRVIEVNVQDTGPGIAESRVDKLFDPFFTTKPAGQGTGLGLSVSRNIVKLHNGYIDIGNRAEGGANARILFRVNEGI